VAEEQPPFNLGFEEPAAGYTSGSQRARVFTESWVAAHLFCPGCGERRIARYPNNSPVADFHCVQCREQFELKSQRGRFGPRVADGAYGAKMLRLASDTSPNLMPTTWRALLPSRSSRRKPGPRQEVVAGLYEATDHEFMPGNQSVAGSWLGPGFRRDERLRGRCWAG
jgi:hypothetical protein